MAIVIVADDRKSSLELLTDVLSHDGHCVVQADSGASALEIIRATKPHLLITDVAMPTMDGYQLAREIRSDPATAAMPIIFYTAAFDDKRGRRLAEECGVRHFIPKPADPLSILVTSRAALVAPVSAGPLSDEASFKERHSLLLNDTLASKLAELDMARDNFSAVFDVCARAAEIGTPDEILAFAAECAQRLTGATSVATFARDRTHAAPRLVAFSGKRRDWAAFNIAMREDGQNIDSASQLVVPISTPAGVCGWMCLCASSGSFVDSSHSRTMLQAFAGVVGIGFANSVQRQKILAHEVELESQIEQRTTELRVANDRLAREAIYDPLTQIHNRRHMVEFLSREFSRAERAGTSIAMILADVDHFKRINDNFGHQVGDKVLCDVAACFSAQIRPEDGLCRFGGEEFLVVLPGTSAHDALRRAEALRNSIRARGPKDTPLGPGDVTVSLGVAVFPEHGQDPEDILVAADRALYAAKAAGRDCSVLAEKES